MERMTQEQQQLAEDNIKLAYYFAKKWNTELYFLEYEEILSSCQFALCKASKAFKKDAGVTFATFASRCMNNEVLMMIRTHKNKHMKTTNFTSLPSKTENDYKGTENKNMIAELLEGLQHLDVYPVFYDDLLNDLLSRCNETEQTVFLMRMDGKKQKEIGRKELNLSQSYVSRIFKSSREKMGKYYVKQYA